MRSIEGGRLTDAYQARVEPYRKVLSQINPRGLETLLAHDFSHFTLSFKVALQGTPWGEALGEGFAHARTEIPKLVSEGIMPPDMISEPPTNPETGGWRGRTMGEVYDAGQRNKPFIADCALTLLDSASYLEALATSDTVAEQRFLHTLEERTLPLAPICDLYSSQLKIDGAAANDVGVAVDGLRFMTVYNLLTNANQHSLPQAENEAGAPIFSVTNVNTSTGFITISNFSSEPLPPDFASMYAFETTGYYGSFIADMYASLAGSRLSHESKQDGEYLNRHPSFKEGDKLWGEREPKMEPRYKIIVTMK